MKEDIGTRRRRWIVMAVVLSLIVVGSFGGFSVVSAQNPGAICVVQIASSGGKVLSTLVNQPQDFNIAIALPIGTNVSVPVSCDSVNALGLAVANQVNVNVNVAARIFAHDGTLICSKGPFVVAVNGGHGFTFTDCQ